MRKLVCIFIISAAMLAQSLPLNAFAQDGEGDVLTGAQDLINRGRFNEASAFLSEKGKEQESPENRIAALSALAQIQLFKKDFTAFENFITSAEEMMKANQKLLQWYAPIVYQRAQALEMQGDAQGAQNTLQALINTLQVRQNHRSEKLWYAFAVFQLARLTVDDNTRARRRAEEAAFAFSEEKSYTLKAHATVLLANLEWNREKYRRAYILYDEAIRSFRLEDGSALNIAKTQILVAQRLMSEGKNTQAAERLGLAEQVSELLGPLNPLQNQIHSLKEKLQK